MATMLVDAAVRRFRSEHVRARYREEWIAEIAATPGRLSPLAVALSIVLRSRGVRGEADLPDRADVVPEHRSWLTQIIGRALVRRLFRDVNPELVRVVSDAVQTSDMDRAVSRALRRAQERARVVVWDVGDDPDHPNC